MMQNIAENLSKIKGKVSEICEKQGRIPEDVKIMAVTKTRSIDEIMAAYQSGLKLFGENKIQEATEKYSEWLPSDAELHFIGHLQRNKAKEVPGFFSMVESVDSLRLIKELDKRCKSAEVCLPVLLEINVSGEESKYGFNSFDSLLEAADALNDTVNLELHGLMTIGRFTENESEIRTGFRQLRGFYMELKSKFPDTPIDTLSMGMSMDYAIAVEEGSNLIRIGTALFGPRNKK
jgi:PLP dependent protein